MSVVGFWGHTKDPTQPIPSRDPTPVDPAPGCPIPAPSVPVGTCRGGDHRGPTGVNLRTQDPTGDFVFGATTAVSSFVQTPLKHYEEYHAGGVKVVTTAALGPLLRGRFPALSLTRLSWLWPPTVFQSE